MRWIKRLWCWWWGHLWHWNYVKGAFCIRCENTAPYDRKLRSWTELDADHDRDLGVRE